MMFWTGMVGCVWGEGGGDVAGVMCRKVVVNGCYYYL